MPIFTTTVSQQTQAATSSFKSQMPSPQYQQVAFQETFNRVNINPTNAYPVYVNSNSSGTATFSIESAKQLHIVTAGASGNNGDTRSDDFMFSRADQYLNSVRSAVTFDILFSLGTATSLKFFIGLINGASAGAMTAIPTTGKHFGIYGDTTAGPNFILSSSNGTTQVTTNTSQAMDTSTYRLNIVWNGLNSVTLSLYSSTSSFTTLLKTVAVTDIGGSSNDETQQIHFYIETATLATRDIRIYEWGVLWS